MVIPKILCFLSTLARTHNFLGRIRDYESKMIINAPPGRESEQKSIGEPYWRPRWFKRTVEADTGEEHWEFLREYWKHRRDVGEGKTWPEYVLDPFEIPEEMMKEL